MFYSVDGYEASIGVWKKFCPLKIDAKSRAADTPVLFFLQLVRPSTIAFSKESERSIFSNRNVDVTGAWLQIGWGQKEWRNLLQPSSEVSRGKAATRRTLETFYSILGKTLRRTFFEQATRAISWKIQFRSVCC
jgi:hypothetical protein